MMMVGWILAGLLLGILIGRAMLRRAPPSLCERLDALGVLRGKDYATIRDTAGGVPVSTALQADGSRLCVWEEEGYRIAVRFDGTGVCLGVEEERNGMGRKKSIWLPNSVRND